MIVKEAIALLQLADPDAIVIHSTYGEYTECEVSIDEVFYRDTNGDLECVSPGAHADDPPEDAQTFSAVVVW